MKTLTPKFDEVQKQRQWYVVDVADQVLGRAATRIARILRGKHKPIFTPHLDVGDFVIVLNAAKVKTTADKESTKTYFRYSGYPHGAKWESVAELRARRPEEIIRHAVWGMMPKNRLGRRLIRKLKVYSGSTHPHSAQQPQPLTFDAVPLSGRVN